MTRYHASELYDIKNHTLMMPVPGEAVYLATEVLARDREIIEYIKSMENCSTWVDLAHVRKALLAQMEKAQP